MRAFEYTFLYLWQCYCVFILDFHYRDMTQPTDDQINLDTPDTDLQDLLDEAQQIQEQKEASYSIDALEQRIKELETQLAEAEQIAKKAQSDYIHIKFDFDSYMARNVEQAKTSKVDTLIDVVRKFTPFIDGLRQSLANIPEHDQDNVLVQGVQMVYNKFLATLEQMHIKSVESIGLEPNIEYHEAISALPVQDDAQKGKIIQEFEQGFYYEHDGVKKIITPAKVVIGQ